MPSEELTASSDSVLAAQRLSASCATSRRYLGCAVERRRRGWGRMDLASVLLGDLPSFTSSVFHLLVFSNHMIRVRPITRSGSSPPMIPNRPIPVRTFADAK